MKRILYWLGVALVIGVTAAASYLWPDVAVWAAWLDAAIFWLAAHLQGERVRLAEASRDRWRKLHDRTEDRLERQLKSQKAETLELQKATGRLAEINQAHNAEIQRLKAECDRLEADRVGAWESYSCARQRADRLEAFIQWLKKRGHLTVALVDQFMKLEEV